jgi:hypothetical protein
MTRAAAAWFGSGERQARDHAVDRRRRGRRGLGRRPRRASAWARAAAARGPAGAGRRTGAAGHAARPSTPRRAQRRGAATLRVPAAAGDERVEVDVVDAAAKRLAVPRHAVVVPRDGVAEVLLPLDEPGTRGAARAAAHHRGHAALRRADRSRRRQCDCAGSRRSGRLKRALAWCVPRREGMEHRGSWRCRSWPASACLRKRCGWGTRPPGTRAVRGRTSWRRSEGCRSGCCPGGSGADAAGRRVPFGWRPATIRATRRET